jgi:hypothetical protein
MLISSMANSRILFGNTNGLPCLGQTQSEAQPFDRNPCMISDYPFFEVNDDTTTFSPSGAMQFGRALKRILYSIERADPLLGLVFLSNIDIADGFYHIGI